MSLFGPYSIGISVVTHGRVIHKAARLGEEVESCCYGDPFNPQCKCFPPDFCSEEWGGTPQGPGTCPGGRPDSPCPSCYQCPLPGSQLIYPCCIENLCAGTSIENCECLGGRIAGDPDPYDPCQFVECQPPQVGCRPIDSSERTAPDGKRWTTDLYANAFLHPTIRDPAVHGTDPRIKPGYFQLVTGIPNRAVEQPVSQPQFAHHFGWFQWSDAGESVPTFCSIPAYVEPSVKRYVRLRLAAAPPDAPPPLKPGYLYWVGGFHTPQWTEAEYFSFMRTCRDTF